jgi:hypothetical protein
MREGPALQGHVDPDCGHSTHGQRREAASRTIDWKEDRVKFLCFGYLDETAWEAISKSEQDARMQECFAYDDVLRKNGHFVAGEALQGARAARTLRWQGGKVLVTDGPFAETRELLGGLLVLEARDMDHAVELMSKHPGVRLGGPFEIRPVEELPGVHPRISER